MAESRNKGANSIDNKTGLLEALQTVVKIALKDEELYSKLGTIVSVDVVEKTCEVNLGEDEPNLTDVKLQQVQVNTGLFIKPSVDSTIIVTFSSPDNAFLSMYSEVDEIIFQNGANDGIVKVTELTTKLNGLVTEVKALKTWANTHVHGAAGTIPVTPFTGSFTSFNKSDYKNDKFKH